MKSSLGNAGIALTAAAVILSGCGGAQTFATTPANGAPATLKSGILPGTSSQTLVYAAAACGGICILSYPGGKIVGKIAATFPDDRPSLCSDNTGDVFVTANTEVLEYPHGGTASSATFSVPGEFASGCAVDPTTNDLAVTFVSDTRKSDANVAVYTGENSTPLLYYSKLTLPRSCAYDSSGNLFVDGNTNPKHAAISELTSGSSDFSVLSIKGTLAINPGHLEWNGRYLTYESSKRRVTASLTRLSVSGSTAKVVSSTQLDGKYGYAYESWIYKSDVLLPYSTYAGSFGTTLGLWKYPEGGKETKKLKEFPPKDKGFLDVDLSGVTVSVAASN